MIINEPENWLWKFEQYLLSLLKILNYLYFLKLKKGRFVQVKSSLTSFRWINLENFGFLNASFVSHYYLFNILSLSLPNSSNHTKIEITSRKTRETVKKNSTKMQKRPILITTQPEASATRFNRTEDGFRSQQHKIPFRESRSTQNKAKRSVISNQNYFK